MSNRLAIRFALHGCANRPFFHLVVLKRHKARDSRPIEVLGSFDPMPNQSNEKLIAINFERLHHWIGCGAQPNKKACEILGLAGYFPITPMTYVKAKRNRSSLAQQELAAEASTETAPQETAL